MLELALAAALLAIERVAYVWISRHPERFRRMQRNQAPAAAVETVRRLFVGFKLLQAAVFAWWIFRDGSDAVASGGPLAIAGGLALIAVGQTLNVAVFHRLGRIGTFYGAQFGYTLPRTAAFPFSWFRHPQYVGTVLSIWGLFLLALYPASGWHVLPAVETVFYAIGARLER